jgi:hypothetical protein
MIKQVIIGQTVADKKADRAPKLAYKTMRYLELLSLLAQTFQKRSNIVLKPCQAVDVRCGILHRHQDPIGCHLYPKQRRLYQSAGAHNERAKTSLSDPRQVRSGR